MKNIELKEYLNQFSDSTDISFIVVNNEKRLHYPLSKSFCITDMGQPVFCLDVREPKNMDIEKQDHADLSEQMSIFDFPNGLFCEVEK